MLPTGIVTGWRLGEQPQITREEPGARAEARYTPRRSSAASTTTTAARRRVGQPPRGRHATPGTGAPRVWETERLGPPNGQARRSRGRPSASGVPDPRSPAPWGSGRRGFWRTDERSSQDTPPAEHLDELDGASAVPGPRRRPARPGTARPRAGRRPLRASGRWLPAQAAISSQPSSPSPCNPDKRSVC